MGSGTQLAHASADMVLLSEQLPHLAQAVRTSRRTLRVIRQNLGWALVYNLVAVPLAASGLVAPWMAAIGMSSSSLVVVLNALRLRTTGSE
jgi:Cu2+-exporting ATPase